MTDHKTVRPPTRPSVSGVFAPPAAPLDSPHIELLARLALAGGTLTTLETREVGAAIVAYLDARRTSD